MPLPADRPARLALLGLALLALHAALLVALAPLPPVHNGYSTPSYVLGNGAALLVAFAVLRGGVGWLAPRAAAVSRPPTRAAATGGIAAAVGLALLLRAAAPDVYLELAEEEGLFEPLTLLAYAGGAALLWAVAPAAVRASRASDEDPSRPAVRTPRASDEDRPPRPDAAAKPWRLAALAFLFLAFEEVDYFGIFGGMIGRIEGEYAGSLHDLIRLWALGLVGPAANAVLAAIALALVLVLWRAGWLSPRWIADAFRRPEISWAAAGALLLATAAAEEAHLFGWVATFPTPEEVLEMGGGFCLGAWAVESAARLTRSAGTGAERPGAGISPARRHRRLD